MLNIPLNDSLAEKHYELIEERLIQRITNILKSGKCTISGDTYNINKDIGCKEFLEYLKEDTINMDGSIEYHNLRNLIIVKPKEIINIIIDYKKKYKAIFHQKKCKKSKKNEWSNFNRILYNIFVKSCYDNEIFDKSLFIRNIGLETCPYCNRNYTYTVEDGTVKPQVDHFFPKSQYPFLAMSYYNLIPSCSICNGLQVKGEKDPLTFDPKDSTKVVYENLINPYLINYNDFVFSYSIRTPYILSRNYIDIELKVLAKGYNGIFKLEELYKMHTDHVEELIQKSRIKHPLSYRRMLDTQFKTNLINLPKSLYYRVLIGNYIFDDELHKRPLSKLYRDVALQLGIITSQDLTP